LYISNEAVYDITNNNTSKEANQMTKRIEDYDLSAIVTAAAKGVIDTQAMLHEGAPTWDDLDLDTQNDIREMALPFIYHGTKILDDLGFSKAPIDLEGLGK
jgi:hypothetical protein